LGYGSPPQSPSPAAAITSHYEQNRNASAGTNSNDINDPAERQAFRMLAATPDAIERLKLAEAFLAVCPRSWASREGGDGCG
jgi:hypothetical protein